MITDVKVKIQECAVHAMTLTLGVQRCSVCKIANGRDTFMPEAGQQYLDVHENKIFKVSAIGANGIILGYMYPRGFVLWPGNAEAAISDVAYFRKWCWL